MYRSSAADPGAIVRGAKKTEANAMSSLAASLPPPTPLGRAMRIDFQWGPQKFEIVATACSVRTTVGEEVEGEMTWLHCKATQTTAIKPDGFGSMMTILVPAHYVTRAEPGPTFRLGQSRPCRDLGIFPPNQPAPANSVPLAELERLIARLMDPSLN